MDLRFVKMQGTGNDFVLVEDLGCDIDLPPEDVSRICDRHFGIGADGVILVRKDPGGTGSFYMHYINADGSLAEMCGNGIRCFAKYLVDRSLVETGGFTVQTLGGPRELAVELAPDGRMTSCTVNMGPPVLEPERIPVKLPGATAVGFEIGTEIGTSVAVAVSMGNPHAILWVDDVDTAPVTTVGPLIERHPLFPNKTNVEFAQVVAPDRIRLRVWERGVGETLACGTGACATLVAASLDCLSGRKATIELPGGPLIVEWADDGDVYMAGPAAEVFEGTMTV